MGQVGKSVLWTAMAVFAPQMMAAEYKPVETVNAQGIREIRGAELLGVSVPEVFVVPRGSLPPARTWQPGDPLLEIPRIHWEEISDVVPTPVNLVDPRDPLIDIQFYSQVPQTRALGAPIINVAGSTSQASPPDPTGDVGTIHFVQGVNGSGGSEIRIYRKSDGAFVRSFSLVSLGGTGACASGLGDPIILFDELANRWVLTEFSSQAGRSLCVYVSDTDDLDAAVVTWHRYTFTMPAFPDYPKYGVWPNAYAVGANESVAGGRRPLIVFDRANMLTGAPATMQRVTIPNLAGFSFQMTTPADNEGTTPPPANAPVLFMRHRDDESHNAGSNNPTQDFLEVYNLTVDWATPANTTLVGPQNIAIAEFSSNLNGLTAFNAFPQPNGQQLDPLREPVMNKLVYRNMGSHEVLVGNMVTDIDGNDTGGIRWFELRRTGGIAQPWTLFQEGTWAGATAPQDGIDRWMAGSAMDSAGNIAMAYSTVRQSPALNPSLAYTGRLASDPVGTMTATENTFVTGTASHGNERWGDYAQLNVDPVDGCTFWFTGEWMPTSQKGTRIASFKFDECGTPTFLVAGTNLTQQACVAGGADPLDNVTMNIGSVNGYNTPVDLSFTAALPAGFTGNINPLQVVPPGTSTVSLTAGAGTAAGTYSIGVQGLSNAVTKAVSVNVQVSTQAPAAAALVAPADLATGQTLTPTLSWNAAAQAASYLVEVATDAGFTNIVRSQTVSNGTNIVVSPALTSSTTYFWRVTASNSCGTGAVSVVRQFRTQTAAGDCDIGQTPVTVFSNGAESGTTAGFATTGSSGASTWATSAARPFAGTAAWLAVDIQTASNQFLITPPIAIPSGQSPVTLRFQSDETIERRDGTRCWDGGWVESSTNGGTTWTQVPGASILTGPYHGTVDGVGAGWCGDPQAYHQKVIDVNAFAGQNVQFRFVLDTDASVGREPHGWYVDDIRVQSCSSGPLDALFSNSFE